MDAALLAGMATLGIAAFDPVGVAAMPLLLTQPRGVTRAWTFIAGSTASLMLLGVAFATGLGRPILRFNREHPWLEHAIELGAAAVLLVIGTYLLWTVRKKARMNDHAPLTSASFTKRLQLPLFLLFIFGFLLVAVQSIVDVVFLLAMVEMGTRELGFLETAFAVATYTVAALLIQVLVVIVYIALPKHRRAQTMDKFNGLLERRGELIAGVLMVVLGIALALIATVQILRG